MISKRSLLLILCLAITGCNMDCVEPGLQSRNTSINVDVPVHEAGEGVKIHWVDSGQAISKGEKIKFTLNGSVNFCSFKEDKNPRKVLVPAAFCADGSEPNYEKAKDINNDKLTNNFGLNEQEVCKNIGFGNSQFYSKRRYVDTGIKVNPGDKLSFSLVSRKMTIDCDKLDTLKGKVIFDDDYYKSDGSKATAKEICKGGEFFYKDAQDNQHKIKLDPLDKRKGEDEKEHDQKYRVLFGNGYTPYDNKVHFNVGYIDEQPKRPWVNGALLDLRRAKIGLNKLCDGKNCNSNEEKKYSSYELNCYYQNICYTKEGIWNYSLGQKDGNCVSSIRYQKYDKNDKCDMYSYLKEVEDKLKKIEENKWDPKQINVIDFTSNTGKDAKDISWAEALVAKISDPGVPESRRDDMKEAAKGTQCLPNDKGAKENNVCSQISDNFEHFSLKLDHDYIINEKDITPGSSVMLAIADYGHYYRNRGGYHVKVTRSCEYINGEKLYVYLGNNPPKDLNGLGTNDFRVVGVKNGEDDYTILDVIRGEHLQDKESKKIYFGIDVSNVNRDDITDQNGKYYESNKYSVTLFVKRKINDFISSSVNSMFDFIKKEVIGNSVKDSYKGYAKGLLQGVRALLTLYVIFTVVGYMLGMVQLSKFDFIVRIMKIAFIAFALSDRSWELFGMTLSKFFVDGSTYLVDSFSGYIGEGGRKFAFLDLTAGVLFTGETWLKFLSLMLAGPFGFIAFLIILHASFMFLKCIISATFRYVISTVLMSFLLSLTPLFIVFILFQQTKSLFDNWIKTLAHVAVQPVILFSSLSILNQLMYSVLYNLTNFSACYQCLISVNFLSYDVCLIKSILPLGYSPDTNVDVALSTGERAGGHFAALPIDLIQAFVYLIIASAMEVFVSTSENMAHAIFGAGFGIVSGVSKVAGKASQSILSTVGLDYKTQNMIQEIKQKMGKDRTQLDVKSTQSETQSGKQGDPGQIKDGSSSVSKKLGQQDKKKHSGKAPDETEAEDKKKG